MSENALKPKSSATRILEEFGVKKPDVFGILMLSKYQYSSISFCCMNYICVIFWVEILSEKQQNSSRILTAAISSWLILSLQEIIWKTITVHSVLCLIFRAVGTEGGVGSGAVGVRRGGGRFSQKQNKNLLLQKPLITPRNPLGFSDLPTALIF